MTINVHIERLTLTGLPLDRSAAHAVQAAVERELSRLLADDGASRFVLADGALETLSAPTIEVARGSSAAQVGRSIAASLHGGLNDE